MTRARGQSSKTVRNRDFPFQVAVVAETVRGKALDRAISFHKVNRVPIRTHSTFVDDNWYDTYCFARRQHAESFQLLFGGDLISEPPR